MYHQNFKMNIFLINWTMFGECILDSYGYLYREREIEQCSKNIQLDLISKVAFFQS